MATIEMSEARLNDLVFMTLKRYFFEPVFGEGAAPRGADIRMCMNLAVPETMDPTKGIMVAILLPNEKAPASHDKKYQVDTSKVLQECKLYMEDHWFKQPIAEVVGDPDAEKSMRGDYETVVIPAVLATAEEMCAEECTKP